MNLNNKLVNDHMKLLYEYSDFFGEELNRELYALAVSKNEIFTVSKTSNSMYHP
jgi:hypothetical protein